MGKTIMKRAKAVFHDLHEYEDEVSIVIIATALDKAEKRGRKIGRIETVMDSYFLTDAADLLCNTVSSISKDEQIRVLSEQIDFMEDQIEELEKQQEHTFDADEVLGLIDALRDFAVDVGSGKHAQWCMDEARRRLLSALSLEYK